MVKFARSRWKSRVGVAPVDRASLYGGCFYREGAKPLGTGRESAYELLRRDRRVRVEALWETVKVETTLRNARDAGKRWSASPSPSSLRPRLRLAKGRRPRNNLSNAGHEIRGESVLSLYFCGD